MINNWNINLINGDEEDIKRFLLSVTSDIKKFFYLPEDFIVHITNDFDESFEKKNGETTFSNQPKLRKIDVFYEDASGDFEDNSLSISQEEYGSIFNDTESNVRLSPMIKNFKYSLTIDITSKSKVILSSCLNKLKERDSLVKKDFRHNDVEVVSYLDNRVIVLLDEINKKRQLLYPGETLVDYIKKYKGDSLKTVNSGGSNNKNILGIKNKYHNVYGKLTTDMNGLKIEYDAEKKTHTLNLSYEVNACLPIRLNIVYPSLIFNQVINKLMIQNYDPYKHFVGVPSYVDEFDKLTRIETTLYTDKTNAYVSIPEWDTKIMKLNTTYYRIIFTALIGMINHDPLVPILNFNNLGKVIKIKDEILNFIKDGEAPFMTDLLKSVFLINIYENERLISNEFLRIDEDLNVYYNGAYDLRNIYRVSFSICINPNILTKEAYARALSNKLLITLLNNIIVVNDVFNQEIYRGGGIDIYIGEKDRPIIMNTVQTTYIQAAGLLEKK